MTTRRTATAIFPEDGAFFDVDAKPRTVVIDAGTGQIAIEVRLGDAWVALADSPYTADAAFLLDVAGTQVRFTVTGDAAYSIGGF